MKLLQTMLLCLSLVLWSSSAWAEGPQLSEVEQQQLVKIIEQGKAAYNRGEFQQSLEKFRQAHEVFAHPDIIYRIALCYERLGEDQEAVKFYRQFLAQSADAPERLRVERTVEVIEARIAKSEIQIITSPAGAAVYIDDEANGAAGYTPTALAVKPGNYKLIVKMEGFETVRELVTVSSGQSMQVRYQLSSSAAAAAEDTEKPVRQRSGGPSVKLLTLATIGVGAGITSVVFFSLHKERRLALEALDAKPPQDVSRKQYSTAKNQKTTTLVVAVSSAAVSAFALIWAYGTWSASRRAAHASGPTLGWSAGPEVGYIWRF